MVKSMYCHEYCQKYCVEYGQECFEILSMFGGWNKWSRIWSKVQQNL